MSVHRSLGRPLDTLMEGLRTRLILRLYGWVFRLLTAVVSQAEELDAMLEILDGEEDDRFL